MKINKYNPGLCIRPSHELMTNRHDDEFFVLVFARKNAVNQWSCRTLEDAIKSVRLFFAEEPRLYRSKATIRNRLTGNILTVLNEVITG